MGSMSVVAETDMKDVLDLPSSLVLTAQLRKVHVKPATNESQKMLNKCETRNKTVFHTRLRHPKTINSVLRIKQIGV